MGYQKLTQGFANLITIMFDDLCSITKTEFINDGGVMVPYPDSIVIDGIQCAFEPASKRAEEIQQMIESGILSAGVTHFVILPVTDDTMSIVPSDVITVQARDNRPELVFERPVRFDESLSSLLLVAVVLRNQ